MNIQKNFHRFFAVVTAGLCLIATFIVSVYQANAQAARFFRISGPAATKITTFNPDGSLVWSNALVGTNYTVQTATTLQGGTNWVSYVQLPVTQSVNTNQIIALNPPAVMVLIPAGSFTIGNSIGDSDITDANPANVYVSAFYMDVNLVTYSQWQTVYTFAMNHGYNFVLSGEGRGTNYPVESLSWYDCAKWCNARSQQDGLTPVYYTNSALTQLYTYGSASLSVSLTVYANWTANGYRLPTEAEWEKAARGGLSGQRFPWGNTISESQANYFGDTNDYSYDLGPNGYNSIAAYNNPNTTPVGTFAPNGYGLYDMCGNLDEWCWDWYAIAPYPVGSPYLGGTDPHGPASQTTSFFRQVARGGSFINDPSKVQCANRNSGIPTLLYFGFRCVRGH